MHYEIKLKGLDNLKEGILNPQKVLQAARSALNKVADQVRTQAIRIVREEYNLPAAAIRNKIKIVSLPGTAEIKVIITGKGRGIPLYQYAARQEGMRVKSVKGRRGVKELRLKGNRGYGGAVSVLVKRGGGRKFVSEVPKPFITRLKSGHIGVYKRATTSTKRLPIEQLYGPGVGLLFGSIRDRLTVFAHQKFPEILKHELEWRLKQ